MGDNGGFNNSIVGGIGALIRAYIKSPNYVAGVSGWSINKDGSAEFNNATFRGIVIIEGANQELLVYSGVPALGNLVLAIAGGDGVDSFGNKYFKSLTLGSNSFACQTFIRSTDQARIATIIPSAAGTQAQLAITVGVDPPFVTPLPFILDNTLGVKIAGGVIGKYYAQDMTWAQNLATGVLTQLTGFTNNAFVSDYSDAIAAGVFTAPVDGFYDSSLYLSPSNIGAATNLISIIRRNGSNVAVDNTSNVGRGSSCAVSSLWLAAGDTITWHCQQTGVAGPPACSGLAQVARRL